MTRYHAAVLLTAIGVAAPALGQPRGETPDRPSPSPSVGRWVRQLSYDLEHLQEDLFFERGEYPEGLGEQVEQVSLAVAHFQQVRLQSNDQRHLQQDFQEMDKQIHRLVRTLEQSGDHWLRRQASRISYSDEQLHFALQRKENPRISSRELLARQSHLLENVARDLHHLDERGNRRDKRLGDAIQEFRDQTKHFHHEVEQGADREHLRRDFQEVDEAWHDVVERLNGSTYAYYLRAAAHNVDRVHNQVHEMVMTGHERVAEGTDTPADPPPRRRRAIEFEIPGIGRFQIPQ